MVTKLILVLIAIGFGLASTGELSSVTRKVANLAVQSQKNDLISLGRLNRNLIKKNAIKSKSDKKTDY